MWQWRPEETWYCGIYLWWRLGVAAADVVFRFINDGTGGGMLASGVYLWPVRNDGGINGMMTLVTAFINVRNYYYGVFISCCRP